MINFLLAAASAGLSLAGGIASRNAGRAEAENYKLQAQAKEREARLIGLETAQRKAAGLIKLGSQLGQVQVTTASRNVSSDSPSSLALMDSFRRESLLSINADELSGLIRRRSTLDEARGAYMSAAASMYAGKVSMFRSALSAGSTIFSATRRGGLSSAPRAPSLFAAAVEGGSLAEIAAAPAPIRF